MNDDARTRYVDPNAASAQRLHGIELWGPFFGALWLHLTLLAVLVLTPERAPAAGWTHVAVWSAVLALLARAACRNRAPMHDLLVGLNHRERLSLGLLVAVCFFWPIWFPGIPIVPTGFLWGSPVLLMIAVRPSLARRLLAFSLAGGWFAALRLDGPLGLGLVLAFGVSWLVALGMTHLAFTGDLHGLSGTWPVLRVVRGALLTALPASLAGLGVWWLWPMGGVAGDTINWGASAPARPARLIDQLPQLDAAGLLWRGVVVIVLLVAMVIILYYLRRFFLKHARIEVASEMPGQTARLEYRPEPAAPPSPRLPGLRGSIVQLWGRWEAALRREGLGRRRGETAAEYTRRLAAQRPQAAPPAAMAELLQKVHYSAEKVGAADVAAMRNHVQDELSRQSLRLETSPEVVD